MITKAIYAVITKVKSKSDQSTKAQDILVKMSELGKVPSQLPPDDFEYIKQNDFDDPQAERGLAEETVMKLKLE